MTSAQQFFIGNNLPTAHNLSIISGGKTLSYAELLRAVLRAGRHLKDSGICRDDRVGILSHNSVEYLIVLFALWRVGAVACLFSTRLPDNTLKKQLKSINCRRLLTSTDLVAITEPSQNTEAADEQNFCVPLGQEATIIFTSGSSSTPKAVLHTFGNHYYNAKGSNEHIPVIPGDQWLLSLPLYHVGGLGIIIRTFLGGGSLVIPDHHQRIDETLARHKITHLSLVPTQLIRLLQNAGIHSALRNLKVILLGGSAIPDSLISDAIKLGLPVYTTYGSTEMASQVATSKRLSEENQISSGGILNYRQLMISETGEILAKGETLFKGYIETARLSLPFNKNGYFATGDIGEFSDDGRLVVRGRKDNMFISGGENIQPEEIEAILSRVESIDQAIVIPVKDKEFGFQPVAIIKSREGHFIKIPEILEFLLNYLPKFKIPKAFLDWPDQIKSDTSKINRLELSQAILLAHPNYS